MRVGVEQVGDDVNISEMSFVQRQQLPTVRSTNMPTSRGHQPATRSWATLSYADAAGVGAQLNWLRVLAYGLLPAMVMILAWGAGYSSGSTARHRSDKLQASNRCELWE